MTVLVPVRRADRLAGAALVVLPVVLTTAVLAVESGRTDRVLLLAVVLLAEAVLGIAVALRVRIRLDPDGASVRSFLRPGHRIRRSQVRSAVLRTVYASGSIERHRHLVLLDGAGAVVLRLTDSWWRPQDLAAVAQHFEVPVETVPEALTTAELRRIAPGQLRWSERHPLTAQFAALAGIAAACGLLAWLAAIAL